MKKYNFVNTFISVCSGTAVFPEITKFPFRRMLWHLFILAVLGSFLNVAFRYHHFNIAYEEYCAKLQKKFGDIELSEKGILPAHNPETNGTVYYDNSRIDYFPKVEDLKDFNPGDNSFWGIAWTPNSAIVWVLNDKKPSPFIPLLIPVIPHNGDMDQGMSFLIKSMRGEIRSSLSLLEVSEIYKIPAKQISDKSLPFREFQTNLCLGIPLKVPSIYILYLISQIMGNCFLTVPVYILIFSLFSFFLGKSNMLSLKFSKLFILGIYTGFPGIIIATLFTALQLPFLDFQSIFLLSYLFYSFPVFSRLRYDQIQNENQAKKETTDKKP